MITLAAHSSATQAYQAKPNPFFADAPDTCWVRRRRMYVRFARMRRTRRPGDTFHVWCLTKQTEDVREFDAENRESTYAGLRTAVKQGMLALRVGDLFPPDMVAALRLGASISTLIVYGRKSEKTSNYCIGVAHRVYDMHDVPVSLGVVGTITESQWEHLKVFCHRTGIFIGTAFTCSRKRGIPVKIDWAHGRTAASF